MTFLIKGKTKYVISKIDGREYCKTTGKFTQHLVLHNLSEEEYS